MGRHDLIRCTCVVSLLAGSLGAADIADASVSAVEALSYAIEPLVAPAGEVVEVACLESLPGDRLAVGSRRGDIFILDHVSAADPKAITWSVFARGLHEPLGLAWRDGWLWVTQKPEVSRLRDSDGDGKADEFETICDRWGLSKNYHEFAFGSKPDREGAIWVTLCLTGSFSSEELFRGWVMRVFPDGRSSPTAFGVRSPGGIGSDADGEMYYTDNQGTWNGSCSLKHLTVGSFQGNPEGNKWFDRASGAGATGMGDLPVAISGDSRTETARKLIPQFVPPAVVLPYGEMGNSTSGIVCDRSGGKFGPFAKQLFVGEQTASQVQRICLEKVNGVMQGAAFPFRSGFASGNTAVEILPNGMLYTGGSNRGWGSAGKQAFALERLRYTGVVPFEAQRVAITRDGFRIDFTEPVGDSAADPKSYGLAAWTYILHKSYGSPKVDQTVPTLTAVTVAPDHLSATLQVSGMVQGLVHQIRMEGVRSRNGRALVHPVAYYTVNELPVQ